MEVEQDVSEGMTINSGNSLLINGHIDRATISAGGEINIKGNVLNSKVTTGQIDMEKKMYLDNFRLCTVMQEYGIEKEQKHRAMSDAEIAYELAMKVNGFADLIK